MQKAPVITGAFLLFKNFYTKHTMKIKRYLPKNLLLNLQASGILKADINTYATASSSLSSSQSEVRMPIVYF